MPASPKDLRWNKSEATRGEDIVIAYIDKLLFETRIEMIANQRATLCFALPKETAVHLDEERLEKISALYLAAGWAEVKIQRVSDEKQELIVAVMRPPEITGTTPPKNP